MEITQRQVSTYVSEGKNGNGTSYSYSRTINGTPYSFTFVLMPNGERRHFVSRYNGYLAESIAKGYATLESALSFDCAWSQVHAIIVPPRPTLLRNVPTDELRIGDVVLCNGMRVRLDNPAHINRAGRNGIVYAWYGRVLNPEEAVSECGIPRGFLWSHTWDGERWSGKSRFPYWNVQGNRHARWTIERSK